MIILDLQSELYPQYKRLHSYYGQPFIWCMLHNFGGTLGLYGSVENINMVNIVASEMVVCGFVAKSTVIKGIYEADEIWQSMGTGNGRIYLSPRKKK